MAEHNQSEDAAVVIVTLLEVKGSAPREPGAEMVVTGTSLQGTIGGGRLEHQAIERAREMISTQSLPAGEFESLTLLHRESLNPDFDQCCGGTVVLLFEYLSAQQYVVRNSKMREILERESAFCLIRSADFDQLRRTQYSLNSAEDQANCQTIIDNGEQATPRFSVISTVSPKLFNITVFGGGHVGNAIVNTLSSLPDSHIRWIDSREDSLALNPPKNVSCIISSSPAAEVSDSPAGSYYLVMTHSHDFDFELCDHILSRDDIRFLGLIGSRSKALHFRKQFVRRGLAASDIDRITCPIGIDGIGGKQPEVIAISVAAQLLRIREQQATMKPENSIQNLNSMPAAEFVLALADIFEHSAWVAEAVVAQRPFKDLDVLHSAMVAAVDAADEAAKLTLLQAHPELAGKAAQSGELTASSTNEQSSAKLDALSQQELSRINNLNAQYSEKFGFPFIIAVLNHTKDSIFSEFEHRVENDKETEQVTALKQVAEIARIRLADLTKENK